MVAGVEALGLCGVGEGGPYAESGALALGSECPVNLHGGMLSHGHAGGVFHLLDAVRQLQGAAGRRQVEGAEVVVGPRQRRGLLDVLDHGAGAGRMTGKPRPDLNDAATAPYWEAAARHELVLPRCDACGLVFFPPRELCPAAGAASCRGSR